jgi:hypothetical protein
MEYTPHIKKDNQKTLPALDNEEMRNLNTKKIVDSIESMGTFFKDTNKSVKYSIWINIIFSFAIIIVLAGGYFFVLSNGGIDSLYDREEIQRRFNCTSGNVSDTVRKYEHAQDFIELYGGTCELYKYVG